MSDQTPKSTIRQILESGPTDPILMEKLSLLEQLQMAHKKGDQKTMLEIGKKLAANEKAFGATKKQRQNTMAQSVAAAKAIADPDARTKALLSSFAFCVEQACAAHREGQGIDTYNFGIKQLRSISDELRALGRSAALAEFLDSPDIDVRGFAAVWLKDIMPDRVLPILKEVNKTEKFGSPVGTQVFTAIFELESAQRKQDSAKS
ncbi:MAG TPA: hypothetical protein VG328_00045 [Stellaceae bacterium]|jgi:hypothetical protein|nr:hypothetical protein [Stellaceae bacterium]